MWATSQRFYEVLQEPTRRWVAKADIMVDKKLRRRIPAILDGDVSFSNTAIRRTCRFSFLDLDGELLPSQDEDLMAPRGTEVRLWKGLVLDESLTFDKDPTVVEWVPLGTFMLTETNVLRTEGGGVVLESVGSDRGATVRGRKFRLPYAVADGTLATDAISDICTSRFGTPVKITPSGADCPELLFDVGDDPWSAAQEIAMGANMYCFYDQVGTLVIRPNKAMGGDPTGVAYKTMARDSLVLDIERSVLSDNVYSGVIVHVEHPDRDPIHVEVWDEDPESDTYYLGPFGRRPLVINTSTIKHESRAENLADRLVNGVVAGFGTKVVRQRQVATLRTVGHPGHDVGDRVIVHDFATQTRRWWIVVGGRVSLRSGVCDLTLLSGIGQERDRDVLGGAESTPITLETSVQR